MPKEVLQQIIRKNIRVGKSREMWDICVCISNGDSKCVCVCVYISVMMSVSVCVYL